ncbi:MAG: hypothetical protein H6744_21940 [Deltaproteobacteria bacterium]|nr:hypothetical protein [Deltaproteobacteria bacterium]
MRRAWLVARRAVWATLGSGWLIAACLLLPGLIIALGAAAQRAAPADEAPVRVVLVDDADGLAADVLPRLERFEVVEVLTAPPDTPTTEQLVARVLEGDLAAWITLDAATLLDASVRVHGERWLPDEAQADLVGAVRLAALGRLAGPEAERTLRRSGAPPRLVFTALQPGVGEAVTTDLRAVRTLLRQSAIAAFALVLGLLALTPSLVGKDRLGLRELLAGVLSPREALMGLALAELAIATVAGGALAIGVGGAAWVAGLDTGVLRDHLVRGGAPQAGLALGVAPLLVAGHGLAAVVMVAAVDARGPERPLGWRRGLGVVVPALAIFVTGVLAMAAPVPPSLAFLLPVLGLPFAFVHVALGGGVVAPLLAATASLLSALALAERFVAWPSREEGAALARTGRVS